MILVSINHNELIGAGLFLGIIFLGQIGQFIDNSSKHKTWLDCFWRDVDYHK